jgi:hypothetical protein
VVLINYLGDIGIDGIATDEPETGSSDGLNDAESEDGASVGGDSENEELKNEQGEDRDSEIEAEDTSPEPTTIAPRSDRLTPTVHPTVVVERVPDLDETPVVGEVPQDIMESILEDVLDRSGADIEEVKVIRGENIIWPDGSMGCGKPGEMYTQAQVPGYWVIMEVDGQAYDFRITESGYFTLCDQSLPSIQPPASVGTPDM